MSLKYFTALFSIVASLVVLAGPDMVAAQTITGYSIYVENVEAGPGSDVPVRFYLANEAAVSTVSVPITYDPALVSLKSISYTDSRAQHIANKILTPGNPANVDGHFLVAIFQWLEDPIPAGDGLLFTALFEVNPTAQVGRETAFDTLFYPPGGMLEVVPTGSSSGLVPTFTVGSITVGENNRSPVFATLTDQYVLEGDSLNLTIIVTDPDDDNISLAVTSKPTGASFVDNGDGTARFVWVPDFVGPNSADGSPMTVGFWASDGDLSSQLNFDLNVLNRNRKPVITAPGEIVIEAGTNLEVALSAVDPDFEPITWNWSGLPGGAEFDAANPGLVSWLSDITDTGSFDMQFVAADPQGLADTVLVRTSIRSVALYTLALDSVQAFPGEDVDFNLTLDNKLPVAGFNLLINYDPSALTLISISNLGTRTESFEYFYTIINDNSIPGNIRLMGVADMGGSTPALAAGIGPVAVGRLHTTGDLAFAGMSIPVKFLFNDAPINDDNTLTDEAAFRVEQEEIVYINGAVQLHDLGKIRVGDINLNGIAAEIGDVIYFTNFFINPTLYTFNALQYANSDVNRDFIAATISDLVALINVVVHGTVYGKTSAATAQEVLLTLDNDAGSTKIGYESEQNIGAVYLVIDTDREIPAHEIMEIQNLTDRMMMDVHQDGHFLNLLFYSLEGMSIPAGTDDLVGLPTQDYKIVRMELASAGGYTMEVSLAAAHAALPVAFELNQNYPNPFNPETRIEFALPGNSRVELTVYNVLGQQVTTLADGDYAAGRHQVVWDGTNRDGQAVASGVYLYRLVTDSETMTRKMMLLK